MKKYFIFKTRKRRAITTQRTQKKKTQISKLPLHYFCVSVCAYFLKALTRRAQFGVYRFLMKKQTLRNSKYEMRIQKYSG